MPEVIQTLDAFLAEVASLTKKPLEPIPLLEEKVGQWARRVHVTLSSWGRGEDANRFSGASYNYVRGEPWFNLTSKIEAFSIVLKALRDDVANNPDFWKTQLEPKRTAELKPIPPPKPDRVFFGTWQESAMVESPYPPQR